VSLGEFIIPSQLFGGCWPDCSFLVSILISFVVAANQTSPGLIDPPSSGVMGFAFSGLLSTVGTTVWQGLLDANRLSAPMFALWITRFNNDSFAAPLEPGGVLTLGGTNSSLYTGDIEFIDMPAASPQRFWQLLMTGRRSSLPSLLSWTNEKSGRFQH
jgi:cathepsin D